MLGVEKNKFVKRKYLVNLFGMLFVKKRSYEYRGERGICWGGGC